MKKRVSITILGCVMMALVSTALIGQGLGQPVPRTRTYSVTLIINVANAQVFVDNFGVKANPVPVTAGLHTFKVTAPGYKDWVFSQNVTSDLALNVQLLPLTVPLTISVNVRGALIFVDDVQISGNVASVAPGIHTIRVSAPGYLDYAASVDVQAAMTVTARLNAGIALSITSNVPGATVSINDEVKGSVPFRGVFAPGTYSVVVTAPGYMDYATSVALSRPISMIAQLVAASSTLNFVFPTDFFDPDNRDAKNQIKIFMDGRLINTRRELTGFQITPGRHSLRITSGSFQILSGDYVFAPGATYSIELYMEMRITSPQTR